MNVIEYDVYESFNKSGSCRKGEITTTYDILNNLLGKPSYTDADPYEKVSCEWVLNVKVEDGEKSDDWSYEQVSIYAWKYGRIPTEECQWNIGGFNYEAVEIVESIIESGVEPAYSEVA
jgi:hypothetical protein|tara:strand:+ start:2599 stop:2955 length:357 start_codon:yes stop_codon:yes gene_type:complete